MDKPVRNIIGIPCKVGWLFQREAWRGQNCQHEEYAFCWPRTSIYQLLSLRFPPKATGTSPPCSDCSGEWIPCHQWQQPWRQLGSWPFNLELRRICLQRMYYGQFDPEFVSTGSSCRRGTISDCKTTTRFLFVWDTCGLDDKLRHSSWWLCSDFKGSQKRRKSIRTVFSG